MSDNISARHVRQVAELVKRLTPEEIQMLLQLAPELRAASDTGSEDELIEWARQQMSQHADEARPMQAEDEFFGGTTVANYFARPDDEREKIWANLYAAAVRQYSER